LGRIREWKKRLEEMEGGRDVDREVGKEGGPEGGKDKERRLRGNRNVEQWKKSLSAEWVC